MTGDELTRLASIAVARIFITDTAIDRDDLRQVAMLAIWMASQRGIDDARLLVLRGRQRARDSLRSRSVRAAVSVEQREEEHGLTVAASYPGPDMVAEARDLLIVLFSRLPVGLHLCVHARLRRQKPSEVGINRSTFSNRMSVVKRVARQLMEA